MYVGLEFAAGAWWTYKLVKSNDTFLASQLLNAVEQTPIEFDLTGSDPDGDDPSRQHGSRIVTDVPCAAGNSHHRRYRV